MGRIFYTHFAFRATRNLMNSRGNYFSIIELNLHFNRVFVTTKFIFKDYHGFQLQRLKFRTIVVRVLRTLNEICGYGYNCKWTKYFFHK